MRSLYFLESSSSKVSLWLSTPIISPKQRRKLKVDFFFFFRLTQQPQIEFKLPDSCLSFLSLSPDSTLKKKNQLKKNRIKIKNSKTNVILLNSTRPNPRNQDDDFHLQPLSSPPCRFFVLKPCDLRFERRDGGSAMQQQNNDPSAKKSRRHQLPRRHGRSVSASGS